MARMIPWETPVKYIDLDRAFTYVSIAVILFLLLYSASLGVDALQQNSSIVWLGLMLMASFVIMEKNQDYGGFGKPENLKMGVALGALAAAVMFFSSGLKLSVPLAAVLPGSQLLTYFYIAFVTPFVEEKFFSQTMPFVLDRSIRNPFNTKVLVSVGFGLFHVFAYAASLPMMLVAMGFRFAILYGNEMLRTSAFGLTTHWVNNIVTVARQLLAAFGY